MKQCKLRTLPLLFITAVFMVPSLVLATVYYPDYTETDQGAIGNGQSVRGLLYSTIGTTRNATMHFRHNSGGTTTTYTFSTDEEIPSNVDVVIEKGAILCTDGTDITISGTFSAGLYRVFSGDGAIQLGKNIKEVYPEWWGAMGNHSTNDVNAIMAALATGIDVSFTSSQGYAISSGLTVSTNYQKLSFSNKSYLVTATSDFAAITILSYYSELRDPYIKSALIGIQVGSATTKAGHLIIWDPQTLKCQTGIHILNGNCGKIYGGLLTGDDEVSNDTGILLDGVVSCDVNGWCIFGTRLYDNATGLHIKGSDNNIITITSENHTECGIFVESGARNIITAYLEAVGSVYNYRDASGVRSNYAMLTGTTHIDFSETNYTFYGLMNGTAPFRSLREQVKYETATCPLTSNQVEDALVEGRFITVTNTDAEHTLLLEKLDHRYIGESFHLYFPASNTKDVIVKLNEPANFTFAHSGSDSFTVNPNGTHRLFKVMKLSDEKYSIREQ